MVIMDKRSTMKLKLTKSRFKLAMECPVKLFYTGRKEYPDTKLEDPFLQALAEGGFQVGELAKLYYPEGHDIKTIDYDSALEQTNELLQLEDVVIFEAAVLYKDFFIRIDILEKKGDRVNLIEVKAKSIDMENHEGFFSSKGTLKTEWAPYLYDAAFQKHVLEGAFPDYNINTFLMLANKNAEASVDGLNQRFLLVKDERGRTSVKVKDRSDTGNKLLALIKVDDEASHIHADRYTLENEDLSFAEYAEKLAYAYVNRIKLNHPIGTYCANCEFKASEDEEKKGKISGFKECWKSQTTLTDEDFKEDLMFGLWNFRGKQGLLDSYTYLLKDIDESIFEEEERKKPGLTSNERRLLQIRKTKNRDSSPYIDVKGLKDEMNTWVYPLHFIDFETTMAAIPFHKGRRPYEGIAFQFSHHIVKEDGTIEHAGEYLNTTPGYFPNYDFIRALKRELENDNGSVFRYAAHENTYLVMIHGQLAEDEADIPDREELLQFIKSITHSNESSGGRWKGERDMIDLLEVVKSFYYHLAMKGSNSIKAVLPAVLRSDFIKQKYSSPVYGDEGDIKSLNFKNQVWVKEDSNGEIISPYKLLPPVFEDIAPEERENFITDERISDGGAAMTAYARMQFTEMTETEREMIAKGLLKYCELDTLAMVMIYEYFMSEIYS